MDKLTSEYASLTPYQYALNSPLLLTDPTGLEGENGNEEQKKDDDELYRKVYEKDGKTYVDIYYKAEESGGGGGGMGGFGDLPTKMQLERGRTERYNPNAKSLFIYLVDTDFDFFSFDDRTLGEDWNYVVVRNLKDAAEWIKKNYKTPNIENMYIRTHGVLGGGGYYPHSNYGKPDYDACVIREDDIYLILFSADPEYDYEKIELDNLIAFSDYLAENANVVLAACLAGEEKLANRFAELMSDNKTINLYMNQDLSEVFTKYTDGSWRVKTDAPITRNFLFGWRHVLANDQDVKSVKTGLNLQVNPDGGFSIIKK